MVYIYVKSIIFFIHANYFLNAYKEAENNNFEFFYRLGDTENVRGINMEGFRFVEMAFFWEQILKMENHNPVFDCRLQNLVLLSERRIGYISEFCYKCNMCNVTLTLTTSNKNSNSNINLTAVTSSIIVGSGFSQINEFVSLLNIPPMTGRTFVKTQNKAADTIEETALQLMCEAAEEEKKIALKAGNVDKDGTPVIKVVCDGSWAKRSYRTNFTSLSGVAAIIGYNTKKVLYMGVKNKYCYICKTAENKGKQPQSHTCYKNWTESSTGMEAAILTEGFCTSLESYGLIYGEIIADGDSNTFKKIRDSNPYPTIQVKKIECKNHLLRNYTNKLRELSKDRTAGEPIVRKLIANNILRFRTAIDKAVAHRKNSEASMPDKVESLKNDILNSSSHIFGEHKLCATLNYFCNKQGPDQENYVPDLKKTAAYEKVMKIVRNMSLHSKSLIHDVNSNTVEQLFSLLAKLTGGKRVNYCSRRSYLTRCYLSSIKRNTETPYSAIYKHISKVEPGEYIKRLEAKGLKLAEQYAGTKKRKIKSKHVKNIQDEYYGRYADNENLTPDEMNIHINDFLKSLKKTEDERKSLEINTRHNLELWKEERKKLCTASKAGRICSMRAYTSYRSIVYEMLYRGEVFSKSLFWGKQNEGEALKELQKHLGKKINKCGLFTCANAPFLGATPDGILEDGEAIVEVKCPYGSRELTPEEGIEKKLITFWKKSGTLEVNKNHSWYYQIQQQLYVTGKKVCIFGCWTTKGFKKQVIEYDKIFFETQALPKLKKFYESCLLPELVYPKYIKDLIREPEYILQAQQERMKKKKA